MCKRALMRVWKTADTVQELKDLIGDDIVINDSYKGQTIKPDQCLCCVDMEATANLHYFDSEIIDNDFWFKTWAIDRTNAANNVQGTGRGFNQLVRAEIVRVADKIEEREAIDAEKNREKLAELTTILNAIPPATVLAKELVERWIEGVKKEMQDNG